MAVNLFKFYQTVLQNELYFVDGDEEEEMEMALDILLASYSVAGLQIADSLDFNRIELRCAYLFLFSTSHSHMVLQALNKLHEENCTELYNLIFSASRSHGSFNVTAFGGGPGSDPVGILTFLHQNGLLENCPPLKVSVVDEYIGWEDIFRQLMKRFSNYPVRAHFEVQNLLLPLSWEVEELLRDTHLLSMVKFISAISGDKYAAISSFKQIFSLLKPGTLILIIDNAGGSDFKHAFDLAKGMGLTPVIEPILHHPFKVPKMEEPGIGGMKYGKRPQTSSTISIVILKKCGSNLNGYPGNQRSENGNAENLPSILSRLHVAPLVNYNVSSRAKSRTGTTPSLSQSQGTLSNNTHSKPSVSTYDRDPSSILRRVSTYNRETTTNAQPRAAAYSLATGTNTPLYKYPTSSSQSNASVFPPSYYGTNRTYLGSALSQPNVSSFGAGSRAYTGQTYSQMGLQNRTVSTTSSPRYTPQPKKQQSLCCLL